MKNIEKWANNLIQGVKKDKPLTDYDVKKEDAEKLKNYFEKNLKGYKISLIKSEGDLVNVVVEI